MVFALNTVFQQGAAEKKKWTFTATQGNWKGDVTAMIIFLLNHPKRIPLRYSKLEF